MTSRLRQLSRHSAGFGGRWPVPSENSIRASSHTFVVVDQSSESIPLTNVTVCQVLRRGQTIESDAQISPRRRRDLLGQPLAKAASIVVSGIASKDAFKVPGI